MHQSSGSGQSRFVQLRDGHPVVQHRLSSVEFTIRDVPRCFRRRAFDALAEDQQLLQLTSIRRMHERAGSGNLIDKPLAGQPVDGFSQRNHADFKFVSQLAIHQPLTWCELTGDKFFA